MMDRLTSIIRENISVKEALLADEALLERVVESATRCIDCFRREGKVLFCGNGGSAADAQHLAAELSGRFYIDREPLFAEAMHVNTSFLTAVANDYNFAEAYRRMVKAMGKPGDVLFAISTSGNSENIVNAATAARLMGMHVIGMTGNSGGLLARHVDILLNMPSTNTPRIQEGHILVGHIICEMVEAAIFGPDAQV